MDDKEETKRTIVIALAIMVVFLGFSSCVTITDVAKINANCETTK